MLYFSFARCSFGRFSLDAELFFYLTFLPVLAGHYFRLYTPAIYNVPCIMYPSVIPSFPVCAGLLLLLTVCCEASFFKADMSCSCASGLPLHPNLAGS
jgi:hypothetical protein